MLDKKGFDTIQAAAKPGVSPQKLSDELRASLPASVQVRTGEQEAAKQSSDIRSNLGFLKIALLAFAGISLFVGAFLIFNTFSITVAQRSREIALLRTLGASRRQVLRSVILEGLLVGIIGGLLGVALGLATASGLKELFKAFGADLPSGGSVLATRTVVLTVVVGAVVSVVSSIAPAIRATRVAPIEALTESAAPVSKRASRRLTISALALLALGVGLMCLGLFASLSTNGALSAVGAGAALTFIGVALVSPHLVRPAGLGDRRPDRARHGDHRPPGARELRAPVRAHRGDRRRADDRRRAGHVRVDLRGGGQDDDRQGRRPEPARSARRAGQRRQPAVLAGSAEAGGAHRRRRGRQRRALLQGEGQGQEHRAGRLDRAADVHAAV